MRAWLRQTRARLALAYTAIFSLFAVVAAGAAWLAIASVAYSGIDDSLAEAALAVQPALAAGGEHVLSGQGQSPAPPGARVVSFLFDQDGTLLDQSGETPAAADVAPVARQAANSARPVLVSATLGGIPERIRASTIRVGGQARVLIMVRSLADAGELVGTTASVLAAGIAVLMVGATVVGYGLAGTALRPVREITAEARAFSEHDLSRRITLDLPADELGELAATFNQMLARLESAFDSLSRFTADAAHELRAPLTLIRTEAEVALKRPRSAPEYQASLASILAEAERLARIADQLLMLARAESGALTTQMQDVDMAGLVADAVRLWAPLADKQGVTISGGGSAGGAVKGDPDLLRRLVDNLIDNALRHSGRGGRVEVAGSPVAGSWQLVVADTGEGVPAEARAAIFDRFSRTDQARGRETGGAGLGLALCKAIAELHHGSIRLDASGGVGARFVVLLPVTGHARTS